MVHPRTWKNIGQGGGKDYKSNKKCRQCGYHSIEKGICLSCGAEHRTKKKEIMKDPSEK